MNVAVNTENSWPIRRAKARLTRASIIDAAGDLFVELGYLGTSIQAIADRAGVSRATVFNSVGGKLHLLRAAFDVMKLYAQTMLSGKRRQTCGTSSSRLEMIPLV